MFENSFFKKITKLNPKNQPKKKKLYSQEISPLNYSFELKKNKDQIINNYNVKVNITKKKTKNISIGNITLGTNSDKSILNLVSKDSNLKKVSPLHLDIKKVIYEPTKIKKNDKKEKFKSALDSPNKSFNKIILNLKNEFEEIKNRNHSGSKTKSKEKKTKNSNNKINKRIITVNNINLNKSINKFHSLNNSKLNKQKINNNSSSLEKLKTFGEKNKKTMEIQRVKNFIFKHKPNVKIHREEPLFEEKSTKSCFNKSMNFDDKNLLYSKKIIYSFVQSPIISFSYYMNKKNYNLKKKKLHEKMSNENKEFKILIPLLIQYIKIQNKVFIENTYKRNIEYVKKEYLKEIELLKKTNEYLIEENNKYKQVILNMMYFLEKDYSSSIINQKKISENISHILKENEYLRELSKSVKEISISSINSSFGTLKNSFDNSNSLIKRIQLNDDIFSKLLQKQKLELTIKKKEIIRDKSVIKRKLHNDKLKNKKKQNEKSTKIKPLKLCYIKKK